MPYMSFVRAAAESNLPAKQVIFTDPSHTEFDYWDLMLLKAYHFAKDFVRDGIPRWWEDSERVFWEVERHVSRSRAAVDREEKRESGKDKTPPPGRYYIPVPKTRDGSELPSFEEWVNERERRSGQRKGQ